MGLNKIQIGKRAAILMALFFAFSIGITAQTNQNVACDNATLDANPTQTGVWTTSTSGVIIDDSTNPNSGVSGLNLGDNYLTWTPLPLDVPVTITITRHEADAGTDMLNNPSCGSYTLDAANPSPLAGEWSYNTGAGYTLTFGDLTDPKTTVSGIPPNTTATLQWTIGTAPCTHSGQVQIRNNTPTGVSVAGNGTIICSNNQTTLQGSSVPAGYIGEWTHAGPGTPIFSDTNDHQAVVTNLAKGAHTFTWTVTHTASGCSASASATITNHTVVAEAYDVTTCNASATLNAILQTGETGTWSFVGLPPAGVTITEPTNATSTITGLQSGTTVNLNWHVEHGTCSDDIQIAVDRNSNSVSAVAVGGDRKCADDAVAGDPNPANRNATFHLHGDLPGGGATGAWTYIAGPLAPTIINPSSTDIFVEVVPGTHTFRWTVNGAVGACANAYGDVTIHNDQPTTAYAGPDQQVCRHNATNTTSLDAAEPAADETGAWSSSPALTFVEVSQHDADVFDLNQGYNTLTWTVTKGACTSEDDVVVDYRDMLPVNAGNNSSMHLCADTFQFNGATNPQMVSPTATGRWDIHMGGGVFDNSTSFNTIVRDVPLGRNTYRWTITDGGCSRYDYVTVRNYSVEANAGVDDYTCNGSYDLNGHITSGAIIPSGYPSIGDLVATGEWRTRYNIGASFLPNNTTGNATVTDLVDNANELIWTVRNRYCTSRDTVTISNDTIRNVNAGRDTIFCGINFAPNGYQALFTGLQASTPDYSRGETGVWSIEAGNALFIDASTVTNAQITNLQHYVRDDGDNPWDSHPTINTFRWTVTYKNCEVYDEVDIINAAPYAAHAGPDQNICLNEGHLNALDHGGGAQFHQWTIQSGGGASTTIEHPDLYNTYVSGLQSAITKFRWTKRNDFGPGTSYQVYQHPNLTASCEVWDETDMNSLMMSGQRPNAGERKIVCANSDLMTATEPETSFGSLGSDETVVGHWSIDAGGGNFADATLNTTNVTNLSHGTSAFRWTVTYNNTSTGATCIATDVVRVTNALPSNANINSQTDKVCDASVDLSADRPIIGHGEWTAVPTTIIFSNATCESYECTVSARDLNKGSDNTFTWTVTNVYTDPNDATITHTCSLKDTIVVNERSIISSVTAHAPVCHDTALVEGRALIAGETGQWIKAAGASTVVIHSANSAKALITGLGQDENIFYWRITNGDCDAQDTLTVINNNPQDPNISGDSLSAICTDTLELSANEITAGRGNAYWEVGNGGSSSGRFDASTSNTTTVRSLGLGLNELKWVVEKGACREEDQILVYNNSVTAEAGIDQPVVCGFETQTPRSQTTLNAGLPSTTNGETGEWSVDAGVGVINDATSNQTLVTNMGRGTNVFKWTLYSKTQYGVQCNDVDFVNVQVYIPDSAAVGLDEEVCISPSDTLKLEGASAAINGIGTWSIVGYGPSGSGNILSEHSNVTGVTNIGRDQLTFEWAIRAHNSCPASVDTVVITNNYVKVDPMPDISTCDGTATLAGTNPDNWYEIGYEEPTGQWTLTGGTVSFGDVTNMTVYNATVSNLSNTLTNTLRWRIDKGICNDQEEVRVFNRYFVVQAGSDQVVCTNEAFLNGTPPDPTKGETGYWEHVAGTGTFENSTAYNTRVTGLTPNIYNEFRWTVDNGTCHPSETVTVYYNNVTANAGAGDRICSDTYTLEASNLDVGESGLWTVDTHGNPMPSIGVAADATTTVTGIAQGHYTFTWTVTKTVDGTSCTSAPSSIEVYNDTPSPAIVGPNRSFCDNSGNISATIPSLGNGEWSDNMGTITYLGDKTQNQLNVENLPLGETEFTWTVTNEGCENTAILRVTNDGVEAEAGTNRSTGCSDGITLQANDPSLISGVNAATGEWKDVTGTSANIINSTFWNTSVSNLRTGVPPNNTTQFKWTVKRDYTYGVGECKEEDFVTITNNQIDAGLGNLTLHSCDDSYTGLPGKDVSPYGTGYWTSTTSSVVFSNSTLFNSDVSGLVPGSNSLTWHVVSNSDNCTDVAQFAINNASVTASVMNNVETCNDRVDLNASDPGTNTAYWTLDTQPTAFSGTIQNPNSHDAAYIDGLIGGVYTLTWHVESSVPGCPEATATMQITNNQPEVIQPTADATNVCDGTANLHATLHPSTTRGEWSVKTGSVGTFDNSTDLNPSVTGIDLGTQTYVWTVYKGPASNECSNSREISITNHQVVANVVSPRNTNCTDEVMLVANAPSQLSGLQTATGEWTKGANATSSTIASANSANAGVTNVAQGSSFYWWTVRRQIGTTTDYCTDDAEVEVINNQVTAELNGNATETQCGDTYTLSANSDVINEGRATGEWTQVPSSGPITIVDPTNPNSLIEDITTSIEHTLRWTVTSVNDASCSNSIDFKITNGQPKAIVNESEVYVCGSIANLSAVDPSPNNGYWRKGGTYPGVTINTTVSNLAEVTGIDDGGTYIFQWVVEAPSAFGCIDAVATTIVKNNKPVNITASALPYTCDGTIALSGSALQPNETGLWTKDPTKSGVIANSTHHQATVTAMSLGTNTYVWTVSKGAGTGTICHTSSPTVTVSNDQVYANAGQDKSTPCVDTVVLNAVPPQAGRTGVWVTSAGPGVDIKTNDAYNTLVTGLRNGPNEFTWTVTNNTNPVCSASDNVIITNNGVSGEADAGGDQEVCYTSATATLDAVPPTIGSGHWEFVHIPAGSTPTIADVNTANTELGNLAINKTTSLRWVVELAGCTDADTVHIKRYKPNAHILTGDLVHGCSDNTTLIAESLETGEVGTWSSTSGNSSIEIQSSNNSSTVVLGLPIDDTKFIWTVTKNACTSTDEVTINNSKPENNIGTPERRACNNTFIMDAQEPLPGQTGKWHILSGSVVSYNSTLNNTEFVIDPGEVYLTWTITEPGGCPSDAKQFIIENRNPKIVDAGIDRDACNNTTQLSATALSAGETGVWTVPALPDNGAALLGAGSTLNPVTVNNLPHGITTFKWLVSKTFGTVTCKDSSFVSINNITPETNAGSDRSICGTSTELSATPLAAGQTGYWECDNANVEIVNSDNNVTQVNYLPGGGATTFTWTVKGPGCPEISDEVKITGISKSVSAGPSYSACADSIELKGTPPDANFTTGYWEVLTASGGFGPVIIGNSTSEDTYAANLGDVTKFRWTLVHKDDPTCTSSAVKIFTSNLPTRAQIYSADTIKLCHDSVLLSASQPVAIEGETGEWTKIQGGNQIVIQSPDVFETWVTRLSPDANKFRWTIRNSQCVSTADVVIRNDQVFASVPNDITTCDTTQLLQSPAYDQVKHAGEWSCNRSQVTFTNSTSYITSAEHLQFGDNIVKWRVTSRINNVCKDSAYMTITNNLPRNVFAGNDTSICDSEIGITASIPPSNGTGQWTMIAGGGTPTPNNLPHTDIEGLNVGSNRFEWKVTVGTCSDADTIEITSNKLIVSAAAGGSVCNTDEFALNGATIPGTNQTGEWQVFSGAGAFFDNTSVYNTTVRNLQQGTTILQWTITDTSSGCVGTDYTYVENNTPSDAVLIGAYPGTICVDSMKLSAQGVSQGVGHWEVTEGGGYIPNSLDPITWVKNIPNEANRLNKFTWVVDKNGCKDTVSIDVYNKTIPQQISQPHVDLCRDDHRITISASDLIEGRTGVWTTTGTVTIVDESSSVTEVTDLDYGKTTLIWTVKNADGSCPKSEILEIVDKYADNATPTTSSPYPLCQDYAHVQGSSLPDVTTYGYWTATSQDVTFDDSTNYSTTVRNLPPSKCDLTWTIVKDGCESTSDKLSLRNRSLSAYAGEDDVTCNGEYTLRAAGLQPGQTGEWKVDNNQVVFNASTSNAEVGVSNLVVGTNTFTWKVSDAYCSDSADVIISNNVFNVSAGLDRDNCGDVTTLNGSNPLSGKGLWANIGAGGGIFTDPTLYNTEVRGMSNGDNTFRWKVERNGCTAYADVTINNIKYEATVNPGRDVCGNEAVVAGNMYFGVPNLEGRWDVLTGPGYFGADSNSPVARVRGLQKGDNKLMWTLSIAGTSCKDTATVNIRNIASASTVAYSTLQTCDDSVEVHATPLGAGEHGYWTAGGQGISIDNSTSITTIVRNLSQGMNIFTWTAVNGSCPTESQVVVTSDHFVANAGPDQFLDVDNTTMQADLPGLPGDATGVWQPLSGGGVIAAADINDPNAPVTALGPGVNGFKWVVTWNTCTSEDKVRLIYNTLNPNAGNDTIICANRVYLNAEDPYPAQGKWTVLNGPGHVEDIHNEKSEITNILPGSVTELLWEVTINGYTSSDRVVVSNGEFEISAGEDREYCVDNAKLAADPAGSDGVGMWSVPQGYGNFDNNTLNSATVSSLSPGINVLEWTVTKNTGCVSSARVRITYNVPPIANFETDVEKGCSPLTVHYENTSSNGVKFYWLFGEDQREDTERVAFDRKYVAYDSDSLYSTRLIAVSDKNCTDTIIKEFTVFGIPKVEFDAYPAYQIYPDATVNIDNYSDDGYTNYYWTYGDGATKVDNQKETGFSHTYGTWGEYEIMLAVNSGNCNDTVSQKVLIVAPEPKDKGGRPYADCAPVAVDFNANTLYSDSAYWVIKKLGDPSHPGDTLKGHKPSFIFDEPGTYYANLWATGPGMPNGQMKYMRTDTVTVYPVPVANFIVSPDTVMLPNQSVHCYNRSTDGDTYSWDFGDGSEISKKENPEHFYLAEGKYSIGLKVYTENGCYDDTVMVNPIVVEPPGLCVFPNAFTPSKSGPTDGRYNSNDVSNDIFHPVYRGIKEYKLEIFNRWGAKIFESTDPAIGWDGYVDGELLQQDVYVWKVTGKYRNGVNFKQSGDCTLLK